MSFKILKDAIVPGQEMWPFKSKEQKAKEKIEKEWKDRKNNHKNKEDELNKFKEFINKISKDKIDVTKILKSEETKIDEFMKKIKLDITNKTQINADKLNTKFDSSWDIIPSQSLLISALNTQRNIIPTLSKFMNISLITTGINDRDFVLNYKFYYEVVEKILESLSHVYFTGAYQVAIDIYPYYLPEYHNEDSDLFYTGDISEKTTTYKKMEYTVNFPNLYLAYHNTIKTFYQQYTSNLYTNFIYFCNQMHKELCKPEYDGENVYTVYENLYYIYFDCIKNGVKVYNRYIDDGKHIVTEIINLCYK